MEPWNNKIRCDYLHCFAGMGVAGMLNCFLGGMWWHPSCPGFKDEKETYNLKENKNANVFS